MRRLVGVSVLGLALALVPAATFAQPSQTPAPASAGSSGSEETRPATTTTTGTTGLWFVPSASVLPHRQVSVSFYRTNIDDGQGFSDISRFPFTLAYGIGGRAELFGSVAVVNRIDRDTRPLFFDASTDGTGGGIILQAPLARSEWSGNKFGDVIVGGKVNLLPDAPAAVGLRGMLTLPTGDDEVSVAATNVQVDAIVSHFNPVVEVAGYGGVIVRGNPSGYELTNGLRWGVGAAFPQRYSGGFRVTTELFSEIYFNNTITAPAGQLGTDGSLVPTITELRSPIVAAVGLTWQGPNGFFIGGGASWNLSQKGREAADIGFENTFRDSKGLQLRIGWHPGARRQNVQPPAPPAPPPPPPPPAPPAAANRPPTVKASCDPCEVQAFWTSTVTADAQDPDGDPLTYEWTTSAGSIANRTVRQSIWSAPLAPGPVNVTVTVNDGRGGTASDTVVIRVVAPREYVFEDVHFEFDRFNIRQDALQILDDAVKAMQANPELRLTIEGHTCSIGTAEYNLALGERRASAVRDYLSSRGVGADRLQTVSFGEERPKHDNSREETRRLNRRAALTVRLQ